MTKLQADQRKVRKEGRKAVECWSVVSWNPRRDVFFRNKWTGMSDVAGMLNKMTGECQVNY